MTTDTPTIDLISHLESYTQSHISASSSLKSAIWDLNKARRQRARNAMTMITAFSALDVREELRAQTYVECMKEHEPLLEDEDIDLGINNDSKGCAIDDNGDSFALRTYTRSTNSSSRQSKQDDGVINFAKNHHESDNGIRQRRFTKTKTEASNANKSNNNNPWSEETHIIDLYEEKLRLTNPLELFGGGLTPRDLKLAQKHAKESLASYVAAANEVAAILRLIKQKSNRNSKTKKEGDDDDDDDKVKEVEKISES